MMRNQVVPLPSAVFTVHSKETGNWMCIGVSMLLTEQRECVYIYCHAGREGGCTGELASVYSSSQFLYVTEFRQKVPPEVTDGHTGRMPPSHQELVEGDYNL